MNIQRRYKKRRADEPAKKNWPVSRPPRYLRSNNLACKRLILRETININVAGGWMAFPYVFAINQVTNYAEFSALFDEYKINAVKMTFTPYWDGNDSKNQFGLETLSLPRVYTMVDKNGIGAGTLATEDKFLEYGTAVQIRKPQEPFDIYIKNPCAEVAAAIGGGFTGNAVKTPSPWLDMGNLNIEHHGCAIGMVMMGSGALTGWGYHVTMTYYLQFRNIK